MANKALQTARNVVLAYVISALGGLHFAANMAAAADATSIANAHDLGAIIKSGVPTTYDPVSGQITSPQGNVLLLQDAGADQSAKTTTYGDPSALGAIISSRAVELGTETSEAGNAYRTLRDGAILEKPDVSHDEIVTVGEAAYRDSFRDISLGGACSRSVTNTPTSKTAHITDLKYCTRFSPTGAACSVTRDITRLKPVDVISGEGTATVETAGNLQLVLGRVGDNYLSGSCTVFEFDQVVKVIDPSRIQSAIIERVKWDDYVQIIVGGQYVFEGPDGPGEFPPEQGIGACERKTEFDTNPNVDITSILRSVAPGTEIPVKIRVSVGGKGEAYASVRVLYDKPENSVIQNPPGCLDEILKDPSRLGEGAGITLGASIKDQASNQWFECTDAATNRTVMIDGQPLTVTQNDYQLLGPLFPGEPVAPPAPICFSAKLRSLGVVNHACYTDGNGNQQCPVVDYTTTTGSDCGELESNPQCVFKKRDCEPDSYNSTTGTCSTSTETWDCGTDEEIGGTVSTDTYSCAGDIACMGTECVNGFETEQNTNFAKVATMAEITKTAGTDTDCVSDPTTCRIFTGKVDTCQNVLGGMQNCCAVDAPTPSLSDYMTLTTGAYKLAKNTQLGRDLINQGTGYWNSATDSISSLSSEISQPFVSAFDSFTSAFSGGSSVASGTSAAADLAADAVTSIAAESATSAGVASAVQGMTQATVNWASEIIGGKVLYGATDSIFTASTEGIGVVLNEAALGGLVGDLVAVASVVGWIYMAYQIVNILVQLIWPCTEDEFKLASDKQLKMCHFIGSQSKKQLGVTISKTEKWCCFNSPLARIIHEQAREQTTINKPWGTFATADCTGFTVAEFEKIDFSLVDLTEWIAMLQLGGNSPTDPNLLAERFSGGATAGTRITGNGSYSANSFDRTKSLIDGTYGQDPNALDDRRESIRNKVWEDVNP
jgi:conjugal transfer mating pair stabilization protein TraN